MIAKALSLRLDLFFFGLFLLVGLIMRFTANPQPSIVAFELAGNLEKANSLIQQWGPEGQRLARRSLYWDFPFILAYSLGLALLLFRAYNWSLHLYLPYLLIAAIAALPLLAGLLDVGENLCLLQLLNGKQAEWLPLAARRLALIKFSFVGIAVLVVLAGKVAQQCVSRS
ncbi:MAG: hypothetical protein H6566_08915 [Lewinellaceae bacterium]|nr:hypothetical protein [Lewinellaceae bacterium]